jgi:thiamine-phosphate pyrophosphorylase
MRERFGLCLVLTDPIAGYERCAEAAVQEGVRYLQLRMKAEPRAEVLAVARRLRAITKGSETRFIVNDDLTVAMEADADGLHVGQDDVPIAEARQIWLAPGTCFGLSTHDETQARQACALSPDYIGVGPVFPTPTKVLPDPLLGPARAAAIVRAASCTAVAIGGIHAGNLPDLLTLGIENFAVVRAVCDETEPRQAIARLQAIWSESTGASR